MSEPEPVIYPEDWRCRTDEFASFTCQRRAIWRITSTAPRPFTQRDAQMEFEDYACSVHLIWMLKAFTSNEPVTVDRQRQGRRLGS